MNSTPRSIRPTFLLAALLTLVPTLTPSGPDAQAAPDIQVKLGPSGHVRLPFDLRGHHVWLRGRVNGSDSVWVILDTGAGGSVVDLALAKRLGLRTGATHHALGAGGRAAEVDVHDVRIEFPGLEVRRSRMSAIALGDFQVMSARSMDVVLGHELFASCVVRLDYTARTMDVWEPRKAPKPEGEALPLSFQDNHPYVEATLTLPGRTPSRGRFVIDSGSSQAVLLSSQAFPAESLAAALPRTIETRGRGVGGEVRNVTGRAASLQLGTTRFAEPIVGVAGGSGRISAPGTLGNIGGQILERGTVTFDYGRRTMWFLSNDRIAESFEADMSGASFGPSPQGAEVVRIADDTAASDAGLRKGDVVTRVDGTEVSPRGTSWVREQMQRAGAEVTLDVLRDGAPRTIQLKLRRRI